jgi:hypothetical protein
VDIEKLLQKIIDGEDSKKLDEFIDAILDHWVYFYFHETSGSDTKPGAGNVDVVLFTSKNNPISVPMVEDELGRNAVVYTNSDLALRSAKFNCKIAKMRGKNAFEMFYGLKGVNSIYIQGNFGYLLPKREELALLLGRNA